MTEQRADRWKDILQSLPVTVTVVVGVLVALVWSMTNMAALQRLTECQARYNESSNANQQLRAAAAAEERVALDELISSIDEARSAPAANAQVALNLAFRTYAEERARIDGKREVMPIPPPPSQTCG
ncbi:hypothetical protein Cme02nite_38060 [Catellatospora methionotrophica]|uniref:Uncharacterized protein n=1 Tax=Catellatospora methionotrophica TaxID=121620 RepID=A0A8J3LH63_9ACTN|nr:hypothetical protein [Catellatospora methionotrophica]GIG15474.1 hypothetical protein Cme02nite_38060 [Catellatospora methionotrophica]